MVGNRRGCLRFDDRTGKVFCLRMCLNGRDTSYRAGFNVYAGGGKFVCLPAFDKNSTFDLVWW